jgi:uncharacterized protein (TIGR02996 family)
VSCPKCGSDRVETRRESDGNHYIYESLCEACGAFWTDDGGPTLGSILSSMNDPPPPPPDVRGDELLDAIRDQPDDDEARSVYADHLLERGDPRGEFIALQLARHHDGGEPTDRERQLVDRHGASWIGPVAAALEMARFERGFLAACEVRYEAAVDPGDPVWRTVEDLTCADTELARDPNLRALRRFGAWHPRFAAELAEGDDVLEIEALLGGWTPPERVFRRGLPIGDHEEEWERIFPIGCLQNVRSVSLATPRPATYPILQQLVASPFGNQLDTIEIVDEREYPIESWVDVLRVHRSLERVVFRGRDSRVVLDAGDGGELGLRLDVLAVGVSGFDPYVMRTLARMSHRSVRRLTITCPQRDIERARPWLEPYADEIAPGFDDVAIMTI